jgi:hypothetical protein
MSKRKHEDYCEYGFPSAWLASIGNTKPSQAAYNAAMSYIESHPITRVDLHEPFTEGFAYAPQVLAGLPDTRIEANEEAPLVEQESLTTEQTVTQL